MSEALDNVNTMIEALHRLRMDSGSQEEYKKFDEMIAMLNKIYDQLVLLGV